MNNKINSYDIQDNFALICDNCKLQIVPNNDYCKCGNINMFIEYYYEYPFLQINFELDDKPRIIHYNLTNFSLQLEKYRRLEKDLYIKNIDIYKFNNKTPIYIANYIKKYQNIC